MIPARPPSRTPTRPAARFAWALAALLALVACGAPTPPVPDDASDPTGAIAELLAGATDGEVDAVVTITAVAAAASQSIVTAATAFEDTPLLVEATGVTPAGRAFKAVFYGPSVDTSLVGFSGALRLRARVATVQGVRVLRGAALAEVDAGAVAPAAGGALGAYPVLVAGTAAAFTGPAAGTVFELRGPSALAATCATADLAGALDVGPAAGTPGDTARGVVAATFDGAAPCAAGAALTGVLPSVLHVTAIDTHLGTLLGGPGWLGAPGGLELPAYALLVGRELPESVGFVRVVPRAGVRVLDAEAAAELTFFDDVQGVVTLDDLKGTLSGLAVGDVVVSTPRAAAPHGFLRRVTAIATTPDGMVVDTERAVLRDAIESAEVRYARAFTAVDVGRASGAARLAPSALGGDAATGTSGLFDPIDLAIDRVLYDQDGDDATTDDQVRVSGDLYVAPRIVIELDCSGFLCSQPDFLAKFELDQDASLELIGELRLDFDERVQLARIPLPPITAAILVFVPEIVVELAANGEIDVSVEFSVEQSLDLEVGVEYRSGSGWDTIDVLNRSADFTPPVFAAGLEAEASLGIEGRLMLYGVAGVSAGLELYAHLEAGMPRDPAWTLTGGLRGDVDVDLDVIVWQDEFSIPVFDTSWPIAEAPDQPPTITKLSAGPVCASGDVAIDALSGFVTLDANTDDAEDGRGQGTVRWISDVDGLLGTTTGAGHTFDATLALGAHTITATATDSGGQEDVDVLAIEVVENCAANAPVRVEITTSGTIFDAIVVGEVTEIAAETRGGLPGDVCCTLDWYSDVEGYLGSTPGNPMVADNGRTHTLAFAFTEPVAQTITAVATFGGAQAEDAVDLVALVPTIAAPTIDPLAFTWPGSATDGFEGDTAAFETAAAPVDATWRSSDPTDVVVPGVQGSADVTFGTAGPRTITLEARTEEGGFATRSLRVRVDDALARP
jgi:hypothetical protein